MAEQKFGKFSDAQKLSLQDLGESAEGGLDVKYGTGFPGYVGGEMWFYHNGNHGRFVKGGTQEGSEAAGLSPDVQAVGGVAAVFHDWFQGPGHEARSAEVAQEELRRRGMPEWAVVMAGLAIEGTGVIIENGIIIAQKASLQEYPSAAAEKLALAMADADMGVLFRPMGPLYMHDFYRETVGEAEPEIGKRFLNFKEGQMRMLDAYNYPSPHGKRIFATHKVQVMAYHKQIQRLVETGVISTWAQLRVSDIEFARSLS